jgi:hypothetical protein
MGLENFGLFYRRFLCLFTRFGIFYQEKSGNPGLNLKLASESCARKKLKIKKRIRSAYRQLFANWKHGYSP